MTIPVLREESDVDEVGFHRTLRAQKRREAVSCDPETVEQMAATYGLSTAAANFGLACYDFPPDLRPLLDAIVGECGDRHGEWFKANDEQIARHAGRSAKWVQRWRPRLAEWMKSKQVALIDLKSHQFRVGETPQPHEYRVNFSRQVAEILLEAEKSADWQRDIMRALEESALNVKDSDFLPSETTNERRTRKPRNDAQSLITRKLNSAGTLCRRALEIYAATGKHAQITPEAVAKLEAFLTDLKAIVEEQTSGEEGVVDKLSTTPLEACDSTVYREIRFQREAIMRQSDMEVWERIEARLSNIQWSKPKTTVRVASYDSSHVVDAWKALNRNAAAAERDKSEPRAVGRIRRPQPSLPAISEELKEEHDYVLKEREGFYIDSGMTPQCQAKEANPNCCARHAALLEVGCLEFFAHALSLPYVRGMVSGKQPATSPLFCEQCQSIGHTEAGCPFKPTDEAVTVGARLRRERRASAGEERRQAV